ncbi:hypothetical protein [Nitrosospira multiformis]|uniref:hypothetical protein n=1 Tax=Nitrosospira multiformis TaxID=1231 RepID=UPI001CA4C52E|nr:hypothetical protein [Nitrosospira multiformis]
MDFRFCGNDDQGFSQKILSSQNGLSFAHEVLEIAPHFIPDSNTPLHRFIQAHTQQLAGSSPSYSPV